MADRVERVKIEVSAPGSQEAARSLGTVSGELEGLATGARSTAQRVQGMASSVQTLVSALGSHDRTAGLIASVAGTTAQFSAMGAMLGPTGALIGGLAGLATGLISAATASDRATSSIDQATESMRNATDSATRYAAALARVRAENDALGRMARARDIAGGGALTGLSGDEARAEILTREAEIERLRSEYGSAEGSPRLRQLQDEIDRLRREVLGESAGGIVVEEGSLELISPDDPRYGRDPSRRRGGGRSRTREGQEMGFGPQGDTGRPGLATSQDDEMERRRALMEERLDLVRETSDEELEIELANLEAYGEALRDAADERKALAVQELEKQQELDELALERRQEVAQELGGLLSGTVQMLGGAIKSIVSGEKSAEDAFKGLAAAFLEMISQYATLKAGTEFADAAASFARYDYAGGAAHIGAGLAFTAVAVATGVGAAALSQAPSAPARPEAGGEKGAGEGNGGDVIINWNSPVVTAGTKAELGREIGVMLGEAAAL